jgi:hypothetical protein
MKQLHAFSASAKIDDTHMCELKKIAIPMVEGKFYIFLRNLIHRWPLDGSFRLLLELWLTYIQPWRYPPDVAQMDLYDDLKSRRKKKLFFLIAEKNKISTVKRITRQLHQ